MSIAELHDKKARSAAQCPFVTTTAAINDKQETTNDWKTVRWPDCAYCCTFNHRQRKNELLSARMTPHSKQCLATSWRLPSQIDRSAASTCKIDSIGSLKKRAKPLAHIANLSVPIKYDVVTARTISHVAALQLVSDSDNYSGSHNVSVDVIDNEGTHSSLIKVASVF